MANTQQGERVIYKLPPTQTPCRLACPAGIDIPRYIRLIADGKFNEALAVIREKIPFASVCGRTCFAPCESSCNAGLLSEPVSIRALKRFVAEQATVVEKSPRNRQTGKSVAIIGAGPAGLTAAYYLAKLGHTITAFEASSQAGGMLFTGLPPFILPRDVLQSEIDTILSLGMELKLNSPVENLGDIIKDKYNSIFIATGLPQGRKLPIPGADLDGVLIGVEFLRDINLSREIKLGKRVLVLGGGGVACDVARSALRLGAAEVHMVCLESRKAMPAWPSELDEAEKEGVIIHPSRTFTKILGDGVHVSGLECLNLRWAKFDSEGGLHMEAIKGSEHILEADTVIFATGQSSDIALVSDYNEIAISKRGTIVVDPSTLETGVKGVFAGGDATSGPASIIEAIAAGRQAATSIDKYLGGEGMIDENLVAYEEGILPVGFQPIGERTVPPSLPVAERLSTFDEVEFNFSEDMAIREANRCLRCDLPIIIDLSKCAGCRTCQLRCSLRWEGAFVPAKAKVTVLRLVGNEDHEFDVTFSDECDYCGICAKYCPYDALTRGSEEEV